MLKILGNVYGDTPESFTIIKKALDDAGLLIAYRSETAGDIIQELPDPVESVEETPES